MFIFTVTSIELGWDCIVAVYDNEEAAEQHAMAGGECYIVHCNKLEKEFIE